MAHFFSKFPTINYTLQGFNKDAQNILTATVLKKININKTYIFQSYDVPAGKTMQALAFQLYQDATLWWVFPLINGIVNPITGWPLSNEALEDYVMGKYGSLTKILEFKNTQTGDVLDDVADADMRQYILTHPVPAHITPISTLQYQTEQNRIKGSIVIIAPRYIQQFVDTFNKSVQGKL